VQKAISQPPACCCCCCCLLLSLLHPPSRLHTHLWVCIEAHERV
jgi:hypothetical protein